MPLEQFVALAKLPKVRLYSLQHGAGSEQLPIARESSIVDLSPRLTDFDETAAAMTQLDLVISCDTAAAHVAGAIGRPCWVAIPFAPDWRWLLERDDSPWYPTLRLFRQQQRGNWDEVFSRIADELRAMLANRS